jgi:chromosomal replication initiator protein
MAQGNAPALDWSNVQKLLRERIPLDAFQRWFSDTHLLHATQDAVRIGVPNAIYQFFIEDNYLSLLREALVALTGRPMRIEFCVDTTASSEKTPTEPAAPVEDPAAEPEPSAHRSASGSVGLNPRYTFDTYVVGASNEMARAAAFAVANGSSSGTTFNPLFIYGGVGLGKTHLLHAIGNALLARKKAARVFYVTAEQFTNDFIDAIQKNALIKFRRRFRSSDVLMIDDVQFLAGKERSQEEFFHTFNSLYNGHNQIILTCDKPATEIGNLEERLVSRINWGMSVELAPPDEETRIAILRKKLVGMPHVEIPSDVLEFLAARIKRNVRLLEGALLRVAAYASLIGRELTIPSIEPLLKDLLGEEARRQITVEQIQKHVAEIYDLRTSELLGPKRPARIAHPRQIAMFLSRRLTGLSLHEIGSAFGGRDHGTVLHAYRKIEASLEQDDKLRHMIQSIEQQLQRG